MLSCIMLKMWFMAMLLAGTFVSADIIISKAWKDMKEQPWHRPELQFPKPSDPLSTVVESSWNEEVDIVHSDIKKLNNLFETKPNCREKKKTKKTNNKKKKRRIKTIATSLVLNLKIRL